MEAKNSGIVLACPMPISRSRLRTSPANVIDRHANAPVPTALIAATSNV